MPKVDRRVRRTQEALRQAMVALIIERGFEAITVTDITERADVGRSTFYAHYADKEDLLQGSVERLGNLLRHSAKQAIDRDSYCGHPGLAFCLPMLQHADSHRQVFAAMVGQKGGHFFQDLIQDLFVELMAASWPKGNEMTIQASVGAFMHTMGWWLASAPELTPEQVDERFRTFLTPALRAHPV